MLYKYAMFLLISVLLMSCGTTVEEPIKPLHSNQTEPNTSGKGFFYKFGDKPNTNYFSQVESDNNGNYYVAGSLGLSGASSSTVTVGANGGTVQTNEDNTSFVGKISNGGEIIWKVFTGFGIRKLKTLNSNLANLSNGVIVTGQSKNSGGRITVVKNDGHVLDDYTFLVPNSNAVWINDFDFDGEDSNKVYIICAGGVNTDKRYPIFIRVGIDKVTGEAEQVSYTILYNYGDKWLVHFLKESNTQKIYAIISNRDDVTKCDNVALISCNPNFEEEWSANLSGCLDVELSNRLIYNDGALYFGTTIFDNERLTSDGNFWNSGLLLKFDLNGQFIWSKKYHFLNGSWGDSGSWGIKSMKMDNSKNEIVVFGRSYGSFWSTDNYSVGYGWISRINIDNGALQGTYDFGSKETYSSFLFGTIIDNNCVVGGLTELMVTKDGYNAWLGIIPLSQLQ